MMSEEAAVNLKDMSPIPLERKWTFWMHKPCFEGDYENTRKPLRTQPIESVQEFWRYYNNIPAPSSFFSKGGKRTIIGGIKLEGWSFFQFGTKPDWEDGHNKNGATIVFKSAYTIEEIDQVWVNALMALIGEQFEESLSITGIRVIDRGASYRLEVWTDSADADLTAKVKSWFEQNILVDVEAPITSFVSPHSEPKSSAPPLPNRLTQNKKSRRKNRNNTRNNNKNRTKS
jgi:translation initiation factor 4E